MSVWVYILDIVHSKWMWKAVIKCQKNTLLNQIGPDPHWKYGLSQIGIPPNPCIAPPPRPHHHLNPSNTMKEWPGWWFQSGRGSGHAWRTLPSVQTQGEGSQWYRNASSKACRCERLHHFKNTVWTVFSHTRLYFWRGSSPWLKQVFSVMPP